MALVYPYDNNSIKDGAVIVGGQLWLNFAAVATEVNGKLTTNNLDANAGIVDTQLAQITTPAKISTSAITGILPNASNIGGAIEVVIDGASSVITANTKLWLKVPQAIMITGVYMYGDVSGSAVVDIWKCTDAQYDGFVTHPVAGDKITASAPPTISSATKASDTTLTGWTTSVAALSILAFNVTSCSTITKLNLCLTFTRI